ncbi:hypothetical protein [Microcoleus sp. herbarium14]
MQSTVQTAAGIKTEPSTVNCQLSTVNCLRFFDILEFGCQLFDRQR